MLVLSRKLGQMTHIGDKIVVKIVRIRGSRVILGIDAPIEIQVVRGETIGRCDHRDDGAKGRRRRIVALPIADETGVAAEAALSL